MSELYRGRGHKNAQAEGNPKEHRTMSFSEAGACVFKLPTVGNF
jgi:hypothetical protein